MRSRRSTLDTLATCHGALEELDRLCCVPGRSERMRAIADGLAEIRTHIERMDEDAAGVEAEEAIEILEDIGGRIGRLQIGCCAPARMPLYADLLTGLTRIQLDVNHGRPCD